MAKITIPYSDLTGADKIKLFRLISLKFARDATIDPSLAGQFNAGQITALQGAIDIAFLSVQDDTADPLGYSPNGLIKVQSTTSGNTWFSLEYKNSFGTNTNALDARVVKIDVRIAALQSQQLSYTERVAIVQSKIDANDPLDEIGNEAIVQASTNSSLQSQIDSLNAERENLLELKTELES